MGVDLNLNLNSYLEDNWKEDWFYEEKVNVVGWKTLVMKDQENKKERKKERNHSLPYTCTRESRDWLQIEDKQGEKPLWPAPQRDLILKMGWLVHWKCSPYQYNQLVQCMVSKEGNE